MIASAKEIEIALLERIINQAIAHGADSGGAYFSNSDGLRKSIMEYLRFRSLDEYEIDDYALSHYCDKPIIRRAK